LKLAATAGIANAQLQLDNVVAKADEKKYAAFKSKMINEKAPAFSLLDVDGKPVSLESLKGKVVVVDFWATWCGPCISSFPGMQKVVAKYEKDESVKLLFIDTWQSETDKVATVKNFMNGKPYTFHVLMDEKDEVVKSFGVSGIPTKFVIDKNGNIRFKSVGFDGSTEKTATEMAMMIELTKKG
jgi:peroxiredoxin